MVSAIVNAFVTLRISIEQRRYDLAAREQQQWHERDLRALETRHALQQARLARLREDAIELVTDVLELQRAATQANFDPDKALDRVPELGNKFKRSRARLLIDPLMANLSKDIEGLERDTFLLMAHERDLREIRGQDDRTGMQDVIEAALHQQEVVSDTGDRIIASIRRELDRLERLEERLSAMWLQAASSAGRPLGSETAACQSWVRSMGRARAVAHPQ